MGEIEKITSIHGNTFLFIDIPHEQRNKLGIASGQSVLLSIFEPDSFYFTEDVQLIQYESIISREEPTEKEISFFEYVRNNSPVKYQKTMIDKFEISKYIHYAPQIKYKYEWKGDSLNIIGEIKDKNILTPLENSTIYVEKDTNSIPVDNENRFYYTVNNVDKELESFKVEFILRTSKSEFVRSFSMKKFGDKLLTPSEIAKQKKN